MLKCNIPGFAAINPQLLKGHFIPYAGDGYAVLTTYGQFVHDQRTIPRRSYVQGALSQPLQAGCTYRISCWARVGRAVEHTIAASGNWPVAASDNLGAYFSTDRIGENTYGLLATYQPQALLLPRGQVLTDTLHYTQLSTTFVAQGGERYFTLGNFFSDENSTVRQLQPSTAAPWATYALDDVSVEAVPPASLPLELGPDLALGSCGGALTLTASPGFGSYRWNTGQTTASIQVTQPGRYVVTADFGCGLARDSVTVRRYDPQQTPLLPSVPALCPGQSLPVTATPGLRDYRWADGPTGPDRSFSQPGRYRLTARTADGCLVADSLDLQLLPAPALPPGLPADTLLCQQDSLHLALPAPPAGTSYRWSTGQPGATLRLPAGTAGTYTLTAATRCQELTATLTVRTQDCAPLLRVPNVVTPNGDGLNDRFRVLARTPRTLRLQVFDRWGRAVFEAADYHDQWPAAPTAAGLYYYRLTDATYGPVYKGWVEVLP